MFFDDAFTLFLQSVGRSEEIDFYLNKFRQDSSGCFAIIVPDVESLQEAPEIIRTHLHFLSRLGLFPALLLTSPFGADQIRFFEKDRLFHVHHLRPSAERITSLPEKKGERQIGVLLSEAGLLHTLQYLIPSLSKRLQIVRLSGAVRDSDGNQLFHCDPQSRVRREDTALLSLGKEMLYRQPGLHLSVTTPFDLLKEIFTVKGAGTIIRKKSEILCFHSAAGVDIQRLIALLEESFGRTLKDPGILDSVIEYHIDSQYRGAVLLEEYRGMRYLSKFAVGIQARGEGVAQELWESVLSRPGPLFWRSRRKNTIHRWYERLADGFHRLNQWTVYWKNMPAERIPDIIEYATNRPEDFSDFSFPRESR